MELTALTGRTLGGKYRLEGMIASGGFGAVFRATQQPLGRPVAVKVNLHGHRPGLQARFKREAQVLTRLRHPTIVQLLDYGEDRDPELGPLFYMVQEFVAGDSLKAVLKQSPRLAPAQAVPILDQVLVALGEAHRLGIVHRDIKPGNLMLTRGSDGGAEIRVLDFGISKLIDEESDDGVETRTGAFLGTPAYMAPEQCSSGAITPATDLYAMGVLLHRMLVGRLPFQASHLLAYMNHHVSSPVPPLPPDVPSPFEAIVHRAMAKAPAERYPSAEAMRADLWAALGRPDAMPRRSMPPGVLFAGDRSGAVGGPPAGALTTATDPPREPGEGTTGGPMVMERRAERPARWWIPLAAAVVLAAGGGLTWVGIGAEGEVEADVGVVKVALNTGLMPDAAPPDAEVEAAPDAGPRDAASVDAASAEPAADRAQTRPPRRARRAPARRTRPAPEPSPEPAPPSPAQVRRTFDRALSACDCGAARAALAEVQRVDPPSGAIKKQRYEEECQMRLPGNCRSRR